MAQPKKHTFIILAFIFLTIIGVGYYLNAPREKEKELGEEDEVNLFMPGEYEKEDQPQQASILDSRSSKIGKFDYSTNEKSNQDIRDGYANCIRKAKTEYSPDAYNFEKITCEQDVQGFLGEIKDMRKNKAEEIVEWWKRASIPSSMRGYFSTLNCMKSQAADMSADRIIKECWGENNSNEYTNNLIYFVGTWMRKDVNALVAYAFNKDQVDYIYLGGRPGEHTFKPYDEEDAYFWYCYFKEEPTYFTKIFKNVRFEKKACAPHGDVIYFNKLDGPTACCDRGAEIVSAAYPADTIDLNSECIRPESEVRGRCMKDWYTEKGDFCGDNVCQNKEPGFENQCNCPQDCPEKNVIAFAGDRGVLIPENATEPVAIRIKRSYPQGPGMRIEYKIESEGPNRLSLNDYKVVSEPSLRFDKGEGYVEILIQPINDYDTEGNESMTITLASPSTSVVPVEATDEAVIGKPDKILVTIVDND